MQPAPEELALPALVASADAAGVQARLRRLSLTGGQEAVFAEASSSEYGETGVRGSKPALHMAAQYGRAAILQQFLAAGLNPDLPDEAFNTPLHLAIDRGHARAAHVLLRAGARVDARNGFGRTPAQLAEELPWNSEQTRAGKVLIRKMLAGRYDDLESLPEEPPVGVQSRTPAAGREQHRRSLPATLPVPRAEGDPDEAASPASPSCQRHSVPSAPSFAPRAEQMFFLSELVKAGDVAAVKARLAETREKSGREAVLREVMNCEEGPEDVRVVQSPLHVAAQMGLDEMLQALLATRADPNVLNDQSNTPLHLAAVSGRAEAVEVLLGAGADPLIKN